ncbi:ABC transporter ATP-binding protein [Aneurinibacillus sp. REN35]|uniref:ABC transporter ATP-binding protein n=1 Tax=Aneurinibacillus sp. REN35 TaxID=3237286 RepID=UPI0035288F23
MSNIAIEIIKLGKMYKLYNNPMDKILDAFGLNFWKKNYYQEFWALRNLDLTIKKGERVGIIGRNGAGKSTLLKTIIGNISPTEGYMQVNGNIQALMELGTGFHPEFTGRQNIKAALSYQGLSSKDIVMKEDEIIDFAELEDFIDQPIKTYSAGMYARLAFSTATSIEPEILIIDEVLGAGDAYFAGKSVERMRKLTEESGATVLFVSHDLSSVLQLCERIIWVDRGKIRADGDPLEIIKEYSAMIRKEEEIRLRARDLKISKKHATALERHEDIYQVLLFHFVPQNDEKLSGKNRVYSLSLLCDGEEIGRIDVGEPMDNSLDQPHHLIDSKGFMDWGPAYREKNEMYREYKNLKSQYKHAPFEFSIPKTLLNNKRKFHLNIDVKVEKDPIAIEIYKDGTYKRLGHLPVSERFLHKIDIPISILLDAEKEETSSEHKRVIDQEEKPSNIDLSSNFEGLEVNGLKVSEYGSKEAQILAVRMLNHEGIETKIFEIEQPMKVHIEYSSNIELEHAAFVFCIYLPDGRCASQWIADENIYKEGKIPNKGTFVFSVEQLLLGKGSYVASVAIFKKSSNNGAEPESYHVLDRSIHFQVVQNITENVEKGLCIQPFKAGIVNDK